MAAQSPAPPLLPGATAESESPLAAFFSALSCGQCRKGRNGTVDGHAGDMQDTPMKERTSGAQGYFAAAAGAKEEEKPQAEEAGGGLAASMMQKAAAAAAAVGGDDEEHRTLKRTQSRIPAPPRAVVAQRAAIGISEQAKQPPNVDERARSVLRPPPADRNGGKQYVPRLTRAGGGLQITKFSNKKGKKGLIRLLFISEDHHNLQWQSRAKRVTDASIKCQSILDIKMGAQSTPAKEGMVTAAEVNQCVTIISPGRILNIKLRSDAELNMLISALRFLCGEEHEGRAANHPLKQTMDAAERGEDFYSRYLIRTWQMADKNKDGSLDLKELMALLHRLNINGYNKRRAQAVFKQADLNGNGKIEWPEFAGVMSSLQHREEVGAIMELFAKGHREMTKQQFVGFMSTAQNTPVPPDVLAEIFDWLEEKTGAEKLSVHGLARLLDSPDNTIVKRFSPVGHVYQSMRMPLWHYFINASRETWNKGGIRHVASADRYRELLSHGVRWVEVRCYDPLVGNKEVMVASNNQPATSKVSFREVCEALATGFRNNPYPIIVSIQVFCTHERQEQMAQIVHEVLREFVVTTAGFKALAETPCPESLKRKILFHGRTHHTPATTKEAQGSGAHVTIVKRWGDVIALEDQLSHEKFNGRDFSSRHHYVMDRFDDDRVLECTPSEEKGHRISHHRLNMMFYHSKYLACAIGDREGQHPMGDDISRAWSCGIQGVMVNHESGNQRAWLARGRFQENGGCGYVIKPAYMRPGRSDDERPPPVGITMHVDVISGQRLPKPNRETESEIIDPYVIVSVHGGEQDSQVAKTKTIDDNGFNPVFNESFEFEIDEGDLALLSFTVMDKDRYTKDDLIGNFTIPVTSVRSGYRHVPLCSADGLTIEGASLLVRIDLLPLVNAASVG